MGGEERQFRYSMRMQLELAMIRLTFFSYFKWIEYEEGKRAPEMVVIMLDEFVFFFVVVVVILVVIADVMMESMTVFSVVVVMAPSTSMARDCEEGEDEMKVDELLSSSSVNFVDSVAVVVGVVDFSLMVNSSLVHINLNSR